MKKLFSVSNIITAITVIVFFADTYLLCVFPSNLILDIFWNKVGQAEIENLNAQGYNYGQLAGLPVGEGVPVLTDIRQYDELKTNHDYITFVTDTIIPLDVYKLKSATDILNNTYRTGRYVRSTGRQWPMYSTRGTIWKGYIYNRYYLLKLSDGNYVAAYLDDSYYVKYLLTGEVQLPVGCAAYMTSSEKEYLAPYIQQYGLNEEKVLVMFCQERYEDHKSLYSADIPLVVFAVIMAVYILIASLILKKFDKPGKR